MFSWYDRNLLLHFIYFYTNYLQVKNGTVDLPSNMTANQINTRHFIYIKVFMLKIILCDWVIHTLLFLLFVCETKNNVVKN